MFTTTLLTILPSLIGILILVILIWKKQWQVLLGISLLCASTGFLYLNSYFMRNIYSFYTVDILEVTLIVVSSFLKAIFILLLTILT